MRLPELETLIRLTHPRIFGREVAGRIPYSAQEIGLLCPHPRPIHSVGRGSGKSSVLECDGNTRIVTTLPTWLALQNKASRPIPMRVVFIGAVKEQAFELQDKIRTLFEQNDWLRSLKSVDSTKTNIVLNDGSRMLIRAATHAARGQHGQTILTKHGVVKGPIRICVDEGWFPKQADLYQAVLNPMLLMGGVGSQLAIYSTPYGQQGEVWDWWSSKRAGDCLQPFEMVSGHRQYKFDRRLCQLCMAQNYYVRHNYASTENPYVNRRMLLETKRELLASGRGEVWRQEYLGIPSTTSGLFFTPAHQRLMWNDELDEYRVNDDGEFVRRGMGTVDDGVVEEYADLSALARGDCYLGIDPNQGVASRRADYAALGLVSQLRSGKVEVKLCQRFREALGYFGNRGYAASQVTEFMLDLAIFLIEVFNVRKVYIDQNFGQAYYVPLVQKYGEGRIEYIPGSLEQKQRCLVHLRGMIERKMFQSPAIDFLVKETKYLQVSQDSLDEDKVRVEKAHGWGTAGAEVDGLFALAYAMRGTEAIAAEPSFGAIDLTPQLVRPGLELVGRLPFETRVVLPPGGGRN